MCSNGKNRVVFVKDTDKYVFVFDDASRKALLGVFGRFAADPQLNFSWRDAAVLARQAREGVCAVAGEYPGPDRQADGDLPRRSHY